MRWSFFATPHPDWVVEINHRNRTAGFFLAFVVLTLHMKGKDTGLLTWGLIGLQFLVYPHLLYWRTRASAQPRNTEINHMTLDSVLFGAWFAFLGFPLWITFAMCVSTSINHAAYQGRSGALRSLVALAAGALVSVVVFGFGFAPDMDWPVVVLCMLGLLLYQLSVTSTAFGRNHKLHEAREKLRQGEHALQLANEALQNQLVEINALQARLSEQATRDPLTGLYNRRYLDDTLERELARCKREGQPLSVMMIDIDHFKKVNDTYGHPAGDAVLKSLADMLNRHARSGDVACRYGGEEFLMLLPHMPLETALLRAEQWRTDFATATLVFGDFHIQCALSVGIATYPGDGTAPAMLIANADQALYRAKDGGRNCVVAFSRVHAPLTSSDNI